MVITTMLLRATSRRVPSIKFRKGGLVMSAADQGQSQQKGTPGSVAASSAVSENPAKGTAAATRGPVIEDWQLPARYRRKSVDPVEMDYINRGGPA